MTARHVALLRGINVGGRNTVPMAELRALCEELGWRDVATYIQSGNVVFSADGPSLAIETALEDAIANRFGFKTPVLVRARPDWERYCNANPFAEVSLTEPNRVLLALSKSPPKPDADRRLIERGTEGEEAIIVGDALWIHYVNGIGRSKLTPVLIDRLVGSPTTGRNWRTVLKIRELLDPAGG